MSSPADSEPRRCEVAVIGAGPAGLEAALVLGRQRRETLIFDSGAYRNAASDGAHMLIGQEGIDPATLRERSRETLTAFPTVSYLNEQITAVSTAPSGDHLLLESQTGAQVRTQRLIIATGLCDVTDSMPGLTQAFGRYCFHCPYCHGWEVRDKDIVVFAPPGAFPDMAVYKAMYISDRISKKIRVIVPPDDAPTPLTPEASANLADSGIDVVRGVPAEISGSLGDVTIALADGTSLHCEAAFAFPPLAATTQFFEQLGIETRNGCAIINHQGRTSHPLVFAAGDAAVKEPEPLPMTFVGQAIAGGQVAAVGADQDLFRAGCAQPDGS